MNLHVLVAGSGELRESMVQAARDLQVPCHFMGFQNQTEIPAAYAASDMLVLPSTGRETWGLVANEAIASGRPVVVSDAVGCGPDLARPERAGLTFPVANVTALADAMAGLVSLSPSADQIRRTAAEYSIPAAVSGLRSAVEATTSVARCSFVIN